MTEPAFATDAVPAATVLLLRDGADGLEVLMVRRNASLAFAGGAWVFPGGRVDPGDVDPAHPDDEIATARRAAAREAQEEAGLALDPASLVVLSRWCPPPQAPKRFNTWFFVGAATGEDVTIDNGEIHEHEWIRPAEAMRRRRAGEIEMIPPTWVTLLSLAGFTSTGDALERIRSRQPDVFVTRMVRHDDGRQALLWAGDAGHLSGELDATGTRHRLWMDGDDWRYERDFDRPGDAAGA
ncbi:MAG: NUDIX domain-containing protein [Acidimicrobiales bacterium]